MRQAFPDRIMLPVQRAKAGYGPALKGPRVGFCPPFNLISLALPLPDLTGGLRAEAGSDAPYAPGDSNLI